jgi:hypothetical protein
MCECGAPTEGLLGDALFFSAMVEPRAVNFERHIYICSPDGNRWQRLSWKKDHWPMDLFQ